MTASRKRHPGRGEPGGSRGGEPETAREAFVSTESPARDHPAGDATSTIAALESENEALSLQLTGLVREVGELKFYVDQVARLELGLVARDERIRLLESELARLDGALASGRPTALAAAAAANRLPQGGEESPRVARMLARATAAMSPGAAPHVGLAGRRGAAVSVKATAVAPPDAPGAVVPEGGAGPRARGRASHSGKRRPKRSR